MNHLVDMVGCVPGKFDPTGNTSTESSSMKTRLYRGLIGKERKIRQRNRVSRFYQDQLITEYLYSTDKELPRQRRIPIRHRSEFLPTALNVKRKNIEQQMELPLDSKQAENKPGWWQKIWPMGKKFMSFPAKLFSRNHSMKDRAIRYTRTKKFQTVSSKMKFSGSNKVKDWQPVHLSPRIWTHQTRTQRAMASFSFGGMAYGCVLGGATAAFVLMLISIVLD